MYLRIVIAGLIALLCGFGLYQFRESTIQKERAETLRNSTVEAVARFKAQERADALALDKKRVALDSVRPALTKVRKVQYVETCSGPAAPDEFSRVFNDAIDASNRAITGASNLPRAVQADPGVHNSAGVDAADAGAVH